MEVIEHLLHVFGQFNFLGLMQFALVVLGNLGWAIAAADALSDAATGLQSVLARLTDGWLHSLIAVTGAGGLGSAAIEYLLVLLNETGELAGVHVQLLEQFRIGRLAFAKFVSRCVDGLAQ